MFRFCKVPSSFSLRSCKEWTKFCSLRFDPSKFKNKLLSFASIEKMPQYRSFVSLRFDIVAIATCDYVSVQSLVYVLFINQYHKTILKLPPSIFKNYAYVSLSHRRVFFIFIDITVNGWNSFVNPLSSRTVILSIANYDVTTVGENKIQ